jgi:hypothetical protein
MPGSHSVHWYLPAASRMNSFATSSCLIFTEETSDQEVHLISTFPISTSPLPRKSKRLMTSIKPSPNTLLQRMLYWLDIEFKPRALRLNQRNRCPSPTPQRRAQQQVVRPRAVPQRAKSAQPRRKDENLVNTSQLSIVHHRPLIHGTIQLSAFLSRALSRPRHAESS